MVIYLVSFCILGAIQYGLLCVASESSHGKLFNSYENALESKLFNDVLRESKALFSLQQHDKTLEHGKKSTFWFDTFHPKPRTKIEQAILQLSHLPMIESKISGLTYKLTSKIIGAEWWIQRKRCNEGIGFHYDKDEGLASEKAKMKHPLVGTVTYLSDCGAPTVILNMTTPDGNSEVPVIPTQGVIVYPKKNRHLLFRGDYQHGVLASLTNTPNPLTVHPADKFQLQASGHEEYRITLLINWWDVQPLAPYTVPLSDTLYSQLQRKLVTTPTLTTSTNKHSSDDNEEEEGVEEELQDISIQGLAESIDSDSNGGNGGNSLFKTARTVSKYNKLEVFKTENTNEYQITIPPGDLIYFSLPNEFPLEHNHGIYSVKWHDSVVQGGISILDLYNTAQVNYLFSVSQPKVMFLYAHEDQSSYASGLRALLPLAKKYLDIVKVYFCPTDKCSDVVNAFGLTLHDLPRVVIDDTVANKKYYQSNSIIEEDEVDAFIKRVVKKCSAYTASRSNSGGNGNSEPQESDDDSWDSSGDEF